MAARLLHYSDLENAYDDPERIGRLAGLIEARRDRRTVVVGTGDNTAPGVLSMVSDGRQALDFFDAVEPDADTFGNHDFDYGLDATRAIVRESPQTWVSANVRLDGDRFAREAGAVPSTIVERPDADVGLVGVTHPMTAQMCPQAESLTFTDPVTAVRREATGLRERGVDHVVVLSHLGDADAALARETDVDAILGGHVHEPRVDRVDGTILTRPDANGEWLLSIDLGDGSVERFAVADGPLDDAVAGALAVRRDRAGLGEVVGRTEEPLVRDRAVRHSGECRIGNFIADAYRWAADADVGLQNTGGIREGPPLAGEVTVADLVSVVPFDEPVVRAELTGSELLRLCEQADGRRVEGVADRWHAHVSGLRIRQDADGEIEAWLADTEPTAAPDPAPLANGGAGVAIDPEGTYTLATPAYLFYADHEFPVLDDEHRGEALDTQYEVLAAFARQTGIDPAIEGRVRRHGRGESGR